MADYVPPLRDIRFVLEQLVDLDGLSRLKAYGHADPDTVFGVIEESGRFMADVVGPLNRPGDAVGSTLDGDGEVTTPPGFSEAYRQYAEAGWGAVPFPREFGGGGFPWLVIGGWLMARSALAASRLLGHAGGSDAVFLREKIGTARFYAEQLLPQAAGLLPAVTAGAGPLFQVDLSRAALG